MPPFTVRYCSNAKNSPKTPNLVSSTSRRYSDRRDIDLGRQRELRRIAGEERRMENLSAMFSERGLRREFAVHALRLLVLEAARFQRRFYTKNYQPSSALLKSLPMSPCKVGVTKGSADKEREEALLILLQQRRPPPTQPTAYLLLKSQTVTALLENLALVLHPDRPIDRSQEMLLCIADMFLFVPSRYPLSL
jgi:hypothetical protein